ncbi:S ribonuclease [Pyrus ussuriensis x Pyrus communis]|uniref:S ribonuclease n=1 Tax=Pyrus ussuriensis x Pyrus communis TaxID=2448454 RepID=A0A5N5GXH0_9ROSA|nr:S ribonuclease [Pyrus ussuriensis x Pyrus communis]
MGKHDQELFMVHKIKKIVGEGSTNMRTQSVNETAYMFFRATFPPVKEDKVKSLVSLRLRHVEKADRVWWLRSILPALRALAQLLFRYGNNIFLSDKG